jgi:hypothetical protein
MKETRVCGTDIESSFLRFIAFLIFRCLGFVLSFIFIAHVLPAFTEDLANLTYDPLEPTDKE